MKFTLPSKESITQLASNDFMANFAKVKESLKKEMGKSFFFREGTSQRPETCKNGGGKTGIPDPGFYDIPSTFNQRVESDKTRNRIIGFDKALFSQNLNGIKAFQSPNPVAVGLKKKLST